jgi:NADPH:quinone reductase-like Zn-dependent oxidoreductase
MRFKNFRFTLLAAAAMTAGCSIFAGPPEIKKGHGAQMQAIVHTEFGSPDVLRLEQVDILQPEESDHVLVKVHAAAANPLDWRIIRGTPKVFRMMSGRRYPESARRGVDFAGVVVAVGKGVTKFKPGDEVFGVAGGTFAEYARAREKRIALKPAGVSWGDAAAVPVGAMTALQSLRDAGKLKAGQKVLINGASGGVGTYGVQIAKAMGAEVTGVCSGRNVELVRSLGADRVIDYTQEDFTQRPERYDLIIDNVGVRPLSEMRRVLADQGTYVMIGAGGVDDNTWGFGLLWGFVHRAALSPFTDQTLTFQMADTTTADLEYVARLMQEGKVRSVIDRRYPLAETPEAIRYLETGRARGKVVIDVAGTATHAVSAKE